jgi:hypothetical protein
MQIQFGTGVLVGIPNAGNLATNPTPTQLGILQEASIEFKSDLKKLFGFNQFPVAKARGKIDVISKAKLALLDLNMLNQLYFAQAQASGVNRFIFNESHTTAASIQVTNHTGFVTDYGVVNGNTGLNMTEVASAPGVGQYSVTVATGTYAFNPAEAASHVLISYTYADATTTTSTITLTNQLMGYEPECRMFLYNDFRGKYFGIELYSLHLRFGVHSDQQRGRRHWCFPSTRCLGAQGRSITPVVYSALMFGPRIAFKSPLARWDQPRGG